MKERWALVWLPGAVLLALHVAFFGDWIVDDAGISFAYAQNLAAGHGLVAQPGAAPVEGYSNPLWVLLLAPTFALGLFDVVWTPKVLAVLLVLGGMAALARSAVPALGRAPVAVGLLLLAAQPAFAIWVASGLENGLYAALAMGAAAATMRVGQGGSPSSRARFALGACAAGLVWTRPEGVLLALAPLLVLRGPDARRHAAVHVAWVVGAGAALLAVRLAWFGDWLPNTFHAKGSGTIVRAVVAVLGTALVAVVAALARRRLAGGRFGLEVLGHGALLALAIWLPRTDRLLKAFGGRLGFSLVVLALLGIACRARPLDGARRALLAFAAIAVLGYSALPPDWMAEWRFATPVFPFVALLIAAGIPEVAGMRRLPWRTAAVVAGLWLAWSFAQRSLAFRREPTLSIQRVRAEWLEPAQRLAGIVGPSLQSILLADVGAMLLWGQLRVHDFGGLVDREFAHARDAGALRDLVLARRADLVVLHGPWAERARMEADPRFAELYEVVAAFPPPTPGCARDLAAPAGSAAPAGAGCAAGIWVRRALVSDPEMLARLRGAL